MSDTHRTDTTHATGTEGRISLVPMRAGKRTRRRREGQRNTAWPCALSFAFHQPFLLPEDLTSSVGSGRPPVAGQPWLEETGSFWLSSPALAACVQEKTTPWARRRAGDGHGSPAAKVQNSAVLSPFRVGPFFLTNVDGYLFGWMNKLD